VSPSIGEDAAVREFARWAREFCERVEDPGPVAPEVFHLELARLLSRLYAAAMDLPEVEVGSETYEDIPVSELPPSLGEKVGAQYYWTVFNPITENETVVGDLLDDLGDIHKDLRRGLVLWDRGTPEFQADAAWRWRFSFGTHWGKHALEALTALHQLWTDRFL
jgi:hypothetical protein